MAAGAQSRSILEQAWKWHRWNPQWMPRRISSLVKRLALSRYRNPVPARIFTGQPLLVYPCDSLECEVGLTGDWEGAIYRAVMPLIRPGGIVLDVGGHVGYSAILFGKAVGESGHVYSFEPVAELAEKARANIALNEYSGRIEMVPAAVNDQDGSLTIHVSGSLNTGMSSLVRRSRFHFARSVPAVALDSWRQHRGLDVIDLVKMDIEGGEAVALQGMKSGLSSHAYRNLLIELHPAVLQDLGASAADVIAKVAAYGYSIAYWHPPSERFVETPLPDAIYILAISAK